MTELHTKALHRKIAVLSDQALFRDGIAQLLRTRGLGDVTTFDSSAALVDGTKAHPPELLFVDLDHEDEDVSILCRRLRQALPTAHIVVIGSALRQGATEERCDAELETPMADAALLAAVALGNPRVARSLEAQRQLRLWATVTPRQRDVLRCIATGADNHAIARKLHIGERAVKAHVSALLDHFELDNRAQLALLADHAGFRPTPAS